MYNISRQCFISDIFLERLHKFFSDIGEIGAQHGNLIRAFRGMIPIYAYAQSELIAFTHDRPRNP